MSEHKRNASSFAAMEASSTGATFSKKRKTTTLPTTCQILQLRSNSHLHLRTSHFQDATVSPAAATSVINSAATAVSGGRFPLTTTSCSSSETSDVVKNSTAALDLEANAVDSTFSNIKLFSKDKYSLSECFGDSEEPSTTTVVFPAAKMAAPKEEIEEFFAMAEKYEQKRFAEKYNYDIITDMPFQGRYQWVRLI